MKRALVLSGGGSKGAYQVGALQHLLLKKQRKYDIICGVSVGALNAALLSLYPNGDEELAMKHMLDVWNNITTKNVKKHWKPFFYLHALWKSSLFNSSPLIDFVHKQFDIKRLRSSGKKLSVGAVSLKTGKYRSFDETHDSIVDAILASSAYPAMLCPIKIDNELWTDGGVRNVTPLKEAIDLGADAIDVIMTAPRGSEIESKAKQNAIDVAIRAIGVMGDEVIETDIKVAQLYNKLLLHDNVKGKRYVEISILRPTQSLGAATLEFNKDEIKKMLELGLKDAENFYR